MKHHINPFRSSLAAGLLWLLAAAPLAALADAPAPAAQQGPAVSIGHTWTLHSKILDEDRQLLVHLPKDYGYTDRHYPVLVVLDGKAHFEHVSGIVDFLSQDTPPRIPPMIVIGVANRDRNHDFTPPSDEGGVMVHEPYFGKDFEMPAPHAGGADKFLDFLTRELMPFAQSHFRTAPFTVLAGHSLGGLFAVHTLVTHPSSFNGYIAMSPTLIWNHEHLIKTAGAKLQNANLKHRFLYMTVGDREGQLINSMLDFKATLNAANPADLRWTSRIMPDTNHNTDVHLSLYHGLESIFNDWRVPESLYMTGNAQGLVKHFADASQVYGYKIKAPEQLLNSMGYMYLKMLHKPARAESIFRTVIAQYPDSANAHDSLVDALGTEGKLAQAMAEENQAVRLAKAAHNDKQVAAFQHKLGAIKQMLAQQKAAGKTHG